MGDERLFLQSDTDEQLLLSITFKDTVNLEYISFVAPADGLRNSKYASSSSSSSFFFLKT
jgi:hypothetical protein